MPAEHYDAQWEALAASGQEVHGEAALVDALLGGPPARVLDAGCGTGRVAIELDRRGYDTVGLDVDPALLERARAKAPTLTWQEADLASLPADVAPGPFAAAVLAGNVMIFVARGTEHAVLANLAPRLAPGGLVVAGFQLSGRFTARRVRRGGDRGGPRAPGALGPPGTGRPSPKGTTTRSAFTHRSRTGSPSRAR